MRHYEIIFMVHPDQSDQVSGMIERYSATITGGKGSVHRVEDWGRRHLAYPVNKIHKAHYVLMNIECDQDVLQELNTNFRYNDAVIRSVIFNCKKAITDDSYILKANKSERSERSERRERAPAAKPSEDVKPVETTAAEPAEVKPVETAAAEPAEVKPVETTAAKPAEVKPVETAAAEPAEVKPVEASVEKSEEEPVNASTKEEDK